MAAVANNASFAKKVGVPQSVGKDFAEADKGKKFGKGDNTRADVQSINQPKTNHGSMALFKQGGTMASKMNAGFMAMIAKKKAGAKKEMPMKKGGATKKMASGGMTSMGKVKTAAPSRDGVATKGKTKGKMVSMKSGGYC